LADKFITKTFSMTDLLHEKAFLKQGAVSLVGKIGRNRGRWYRNVGLGIKTPKEAIEGTYIDKKCPFTGNVSVRGRIFRGVIISTKMTRTVIVRRDYLHYQRKYKRFEKRHRNIPAHSSPAFRLREGDQVTIAQTRPTSKTKRFTVVKLDRAAPSADGKKIFAGM
jgi:small subunit ribosomal protein S11e